MKNKKLVKIIEKSAANQFADFYIALQPLHLLKSCGYHEVFAYEVLSRHDTLSPDEFVPIISNMGLITEFTRSVIKKLLAFINDNHCTCADIRYYINVSPSMLKLNSEFVSDFIRLCEEYNVPNHCIGIEITEQDHIEDIIEAKVVIETLVELGFDIVLDDFGSYLSGIDRLIDLKVSKIKLDKKISKASSLRNSAAIKHLINLSKDIEVDVICEGIETHEQLAGLMNHGAQHFQGYLFSRPYTIKNNNDSIKRAKITAIISVAAHNANSCLSNEHVQNEKTHTSDVLISTQDCAINLKDLNANICIARPVSITLQRGKNDPIVVDGFPTSNLSFQQNTYVVFSFMSASKHDQQGILKLIESTMAQKKLTADPNNKTKIIIDKLKFSRGFVVLSVKFFILAFSLIVALSLLFSNHDTNLAESKPTLTKHNIDIAQVKLAQFVSVKKRLPCPADGRLAKDDPQAGIEMIDEEYNCINNQMHGVLPWKTIAMPSEYALDAWGNNFFYRVSPYLTKSSSMDMRNCSYSGKENALTTNYTCSINKNCQGESCTSVENFLWCNDGYCFDKKGKGLDVVDVNGNVVNDNTFIKGKKHTGAAYVLLSHGANLSGNPTDARGRVKRSKEPVSALENQFNDQQRSVSTQYTTRSDKAESSDNETFDDIVVSPSVLSVVHDANLNPENK